MAEEYGETMEGRALGNTAGSSLGALYAASKFIAKGSRYKRYYSKTENRVDGVRV